MGGSFSRFAVGHGLNEGESLFRFDPFPQGILSLRDPAEESAGPPVHPSIRSRKTVVLHSRVSHPNAPSGAEIVTPTDFPDK